MKSQFRTIMHPYFVNYSTLMTQKERLFYYWTGRILFISPIEISKLAKRKIVVEVGYRIALEGEVPSFLVGIEILYVSFVKVLEENKGWFKRHVNLKLHQLKPPYDADVLLCHFQPQNFLQKKFA